ncbi:hypothetical protein [Candidatus Poriferisodalis sp.]|uniref:hypothetical protein n=1 Tax=Candidatus Poriferisodalis sp. TaxID=3101277 RepID=UPI003B0287CD
MSATPADRQHYDAIVVGGGPVGSIASLRRLSADLTLTAASENTGRIAWTSC